MAQSFARKFNLRFTDQISYLAGLHRSGWPMVTRTLLSLHDAQSPVKLDTYVDRTFHWLKPSYIPYTSAWAGFVHHTFNDTYSPYNNVTLLKNEDFLASLEHCVGLYVFSTRQRDRWRQELDALGFTGVPVQSLTHPTDLSGFVPWTPARFYANHDKRLVQVGAWMRDSYAIYRFGGPKHFISVDAGNGNDDEAFTLIKSNLQGPQMGFYFKPPNFFRLLRPPQWKDYVGPTPPMSYRAVLRNEESPTEIISPNGDMILPAEEEEEDPNMCRDVMCRDSDMYLNKYVLGAIELLRDYDKSVTVLPTMDNTDYDILLSQNVVFLPLIDAAAVNVLIECIARNTPVLVSRLPAIEEVLGSDYPLYYDASKEMDVSANLTESSIMAAHDYMVNFDKSILHANTFLAEITGGEIYGKI